MKHISHRGNISGREPEKENSPSFIEIAISKGYDVEIDFRTHENKLYLGHDTPDYLVDLDWVFDKKDSLWIHCKDLKTAQKLFELSKDVTGLKYFCHNEDDFTLVSSGHIWVHYNPLDKFNEYLDGNCIIPLLDLELIEKYYNPNVYGICSDYVTEISKLNNSKIE